MPFIPPEICFEATVAIESVFRGSGDEWRDDGVRGVTMAWRWRRDGVAYLAWRWRGDGVRGDGVCGVFGVFF